MIVVPPPPKHGLSLHCIHYIRTPPPTTWPLNPRIIFIIAAPPPPQTWSFTPLCPLHTTPPPTTWPVNPQIRNAIINTYTKRFLLICDLRIVKLSDSLETHFFSINALLRSLSKVSTFGFSSNELVEE